MTPTRIFLGWDRPVTELTVDRLVAVGAKDDGLPPDLGGILVVAPTRQTGRRLRERLAAARPQGVLSPRVVTPEFFFQPADSAALLPDTEALVLAADLLGRLPPDGFSHLFPTVPPQDWAWRFGAARHWFQLRQLLAEGGLTIAEAARRLADGPEPERWEELATFEAWYLKEVAAAGREDRLLRQFAAAAQPAVPEGVETIVLAGVPDPAPLALCALEQLAARMPVDVWVHAPEEKAERFDAWGRPLPDAWAAATVACPETRIILALKPEQQAVEAVRRLPPELSGAKGAAPGLLAVGVPDPEVVPHLERALERLGLPVFNPADRPLAAHPLAVLATDLLTLAAEDRFEDFSRLLRHPDILADLARNADITRPEALLTAVDTLQNTHLPATLRALRAHAAAAADAAAVLRACDRVETLLAPLRGDGWAETLPAVLAAFYAHRRLDPRRPDDQDFTTAAERLMELLDALRAPFIRRRLRDGAAQRLLFRQRLAEETLAPNPDAPAVTLDGWLELHGNDAPHLLLTGFNEEFVPAVVTRHAFLPDGARRALGLPDGDRRFARDLYLFQAMLACRRQSGSVTVILGKSSAAGDALKPSRLLFRCPDDVLPARARRLFGKASLPEGETTAADGGAWRLQLPADAPAPDHLSPTAFRAYLACPFRFFLSHCLRLAELDDRAVELDAADFGNACHHAFKRFADTPEWRDSTDGDAIARFLAGEAEAWFGARFGDSGTAALLVQKDALLQRLRHAARVQADQRREGWRILPDLCEATLEDDLLPGLTLRGRIDRVERNENTGEYRVLDLKTTDSGAAPRETHLGAKRNDTPPFALCTFGGKEKRWMDLQLPLYVRLLRRRLGDPAAVIRCGYFTLPKAVTSTQIRLFAELTPDLQEAAEQCALLIAEAVRRREFWPPVEKIRYDEFERLCPAGEWRRRFTPPPESDKSDKPGKPLNFSIS